MAVWYNDKKLKVTSICLFCCLLLKVCLAKSGSHPGMHLALHVPIGLVAKLLPDGILMCPRSRDWWEPYEENEKEKKKKKKREKRGKEEG